MEKITVVVAGNFIQEVLEDFVVNFSKSDKLIGVDEENE